MAGWVLASFAVVGLIWSGLLTACLLLAVASAVAGGWRAAARRRAYRRARRRWSREAESIAAARLAAVPVPADDRGYPLPLRLSRRRMWRQVDAIRRQQGPGGDA